MIEKTSTSGITQNEIAVYYLLNEDEAQNYMDNLLRKANEILLLESKTLVRMILNYFKWDESGLDRFYEDPDRVFDALGVANPNISPVLQWNPLSPGYTPMKGPFAERAESVTERQCRTCSEEKRREEFEILPCRHQHCIKCCQSYLEHSLSQFDHPQAISCPSRCTQIIDDDAIERLIQHNPALIKRYKRYLLNCFVQNNRVTRWCPGNDCSIVIRIKTYNPSGTTMIECDFCKTTSCFKCSQPWHEPIQCSLLEKWNKKNADESMNATYLIANTKPCPKCSTNIEKNGGCNHMTCRRPGCVHEFCWLCFGDWHQHQAQNCNAFHVQDEANRSDVRAALERYMHYFTRFQTHNQSLKFEKDLKEKLDKRMRVAETGQNAILDRQALQKAFNALLFCRRTLTYSYPFAYYLERNNHTEIFEENQGHLSTAVETLSRFLEEDDPMDANFAVTVMDKATFCERRCKVLLEHCKDGYKNGIWIGIDPY